MTNIWTLVYDAQSCVCEFCIFFFCDMKKILTVKATTGTSRTSSQMKELQTRWNVLFQSKYLPVRFHVCEDVVSVTF